MLQAIEVVGETQQQGLPTLSKQASSGSAAGELALGGGEDGFDQSTWAIETAGKVVAHFGAYSVDAPGFLAAFELSLRRGGCCGVDRPSA